MNVTFKSLQRLKEEIYVNSLYRKLRLFGRERISATCSQKMLVKRQFFLNIFSL